MGGHRGEVRNTRISRSIKKYGFNNFTVDTIQTHSLEEKAKQHEVQLIAEHQTNIRRHPDGNGLNMTDGGEGATGFKHSKQQKEKWSKQRKGTNTGPREHWRGKDNPNSKKVYLFTPTGELLKIFTSAKETAEYLNVDPSNVSRCCRGIIKTITDRICQYTPQFVPRYIITTNSKHVKQLSVIGELLHVFPSIEEAARTLNVNRSGIDKCLMGNIKTSHGFMWSR